MRDGPGELAEAPWLPRAFALTVAAVGAILLWIILVPHRVGDYFTETDFYGAYAEGARLLQHGTLDPSRYTVIGPLYEVVLGAIGFVVRDLFLAGQLISLAATCGTLILWFTLMRRRLHSAAGLWTALFLAANATFVRYGYSATTDALAMFLQAAALFALFAMRGGRAPLWAGLLSALAALTRYNAIYLVPGAVVAYLWLDPPREGSRKRALALYAAGFAVLVLPWLAVSFRQGQAPGAALFHNIAYDVYARARGITWDEYQAKMQSQFHSLWDVIRRDPGAVVRRELQNVAEHFRLDMKSLLGWPVAAVCAFGVLVSLQGGWRRLLPATICGVFLFLTLVPAFYSERYSLPLAPIYLCWAGLGVGSTFLAVGVRGIPLPLKWLLALWPLWLSARANIEYQRHLFTQLPVEVLSAGDALRQAGPEGARLLARKPHVAYYARMRAMPFPSVTTLPELADYCHKNGIDYMYFSWPEAETRPQFWYLLDTSAVVPGLELLRFVSKNPAAVYRITPAFGQAPAWLANDTLMTTHAARAQLLVNPMNLRAQLTVGLFERAHMRPEQALSHFLAMTRIEPRNKDGWILSGEAFLVLGRLDRAESAYLRAIQLDPQNVDAHVGLGWVYVGRGDARQAAAMWKPAIDLVDDIPTLRMMVNVFDEVVDPAAAAAARAALARRGNR